MSQEEHKNLLSISGTGIVVFTWRQVSLWLLLPFSWFIKMFFPIIKIVVLYLDVTHKFLYVISLSQHKRSVVDVSAIYLSIINSNINNMWLSLTHFHWTAKASQSMLRYESGFNAFFHSKKSVFLFWIIIKIHKKIRKKWSFFYISVPSIARNIQFI